MKASREQIAQFLIDEGLSNWVEKSERGEFLVNSIFVSDNKKKMGVNWKRGVFNCFKSGVGGTFVRFVKHVKKFESDKEAAIYFMRNYFTREDTLNYFNEPDEDEVVETALSFPPGTEKLTNQMEYISYLKSRNFSDEMIDRSNLFINKQEKRVIFPVYDGGKLSFFAKRSINPDSPLRWINSGGSSSDAIWNLDNVGDIIYIFEGIFDAIRVWPSGVAIFGASLRKGQADKILNKKPYKIVVVGDGDSVGRQGAERSANLLSSRHKNVHIHLWEVGSKDFGEMKDPKINDVLFDNKGRMLRLYNEVVNFK